jgi:hypothetical protein
MKTFHELLKLVSRRMKICHSSNYLQGYGPTLLYATGTCALKASPNNLIIEYVPII